MKLKLALMTTVFFALICNHAYSQNFEPSGVVWVPSDGAELIAMHEKALVRGTPTNYKIIYTGSGATKPYYITSAVTFTELETFEFEPKAMFDGADIYISGEIKDTQSQIHTGNLYFTEDYEGIIRPEWMGRDADALNWSVDASFGGGTAVPFKSISVYYGCPTIHLNGSYNISEQVFLKMGINMVSHNAKITAISDMDTMLGTPVSGADIQGSLTFRELL